MNTNYCSPQLTIWVIELKQPLLSGSNFNDLSNEDFSSDGQLSFE